MIKRQHVVSEFFDEAETMREVLDARLRDVYASTVRWEYFCDPQMYTYLRVPPQEIFPKEIFDRFMLRLRSWCMEHLGLVPVHLPSLHLMVNGCRLGLHSDFHNGTWGYVYSLTRWNNRKFSGGETLLMRDGIPSYKKHHVQGKELYELIPANFNQLLVFDDRMVHGTPVIEGSMDPLEGRIAMVGHIRATSPLVRGSLQLADVRRVFLDGMLHLGEKIGTFKDVQGTVTYRLVIGAGGMVQSVTTLTDNLVTSLRGYQPSEAVAMVKSTIQQAMANLRFPSTSAESTAVLPVLVPLPDLRPMEFSVPHDLPHEWICEWAIAHLSEIDELEFRGDWRGRTYVVREPVAGSIRIEPHRVAFLFDPPMWVPSQRERFQAALMHWASALVTKSAPVEDGHPPVITGGAS